MIINNWIFLILFEFTLFLQRKGKGINQQTLSLGTASLGKNGTKKWRFPSRISSVNLTKSTENCKFAHIYWRNS